MGKISIEFGAMAPSLNEQPVAQYLDKNDLQRFEMIAHSITVMTVHGYIGRAQSDKARDRLCKNIIKAIKPPQEQPK